MILAVEAGTSMATFFLGFAPSSTSLLRFFPLLSPIVAEELRKCVHEQRRLAIPLQVFRRSGMSLNFFGTAAGRKTLGRFSAASGEGSRPHHSTGTRHSTPWQAIPTTARICSSIAQLLAGCGYHSGFSRVLCRVQCVQLPVFQKHNVLLNNRNTSTTTFEAGATLSGPSRLIQYGTITVEVITGRKIEAMSA